jgi:hypothetical protein
MRAADLARRLRDEMEAPSAVGNYESTPLDEPISDARMEDEAAMDPITESVPTEIDESMTEAEAPLRRAILKDRRSLLIEEDRMFLFHPRMEIL